MNKRNQWREEKVEPLFQTLSIADVEEISTESGTSIPSEQAVIDAKDWIDDNKK